MLSVIPQETHGEVEEVLGALSRESGMPTVVVAAIEGTSWSPRALRDDAKFGITVGERKQLDETLCGEVVREANGGLAIDDARHDPRYRKHPALRRHGVVSYVGVPLHRPDGGIIGTLCALDRSPHVGLCAALGLYRVLARFLAHELELLEKARESRLALRAETENGLSRERFLAAVAHDLRTPLAAIAATVQLIRARRSIPTEEGVRRILYSTERMSRLIDDLLDLARGRLGDGIPIRRAPIEDVERLLMEVLSEAAAAHGADATVDIELDGIVVDWDRDRIAQCLDNVLTNAFVHGGHSTPVRLRARAEAMRVTIEIVNSGAIPNSERTSLFAPFREAQRVRRGLGLGLFIADQIVRAHGGTIDLVAEHGETTTRIVLPVA